MLCLPPANPITDINFILVFLHLGPSTSCSARRSSKRVAPPPPTRTSILSASADSSYSTYSSSPLTESDIQQGSSFSSLSDKSDHSHGKNDILTGTPANQCDKAIEGTSNQSSCSAKQGTSNQRSDNVKQGTSNQKQRQDSDVESHQFSDTEIHQLRDIGSHQFSDSESHQLRNIESQQLSDIDVESQNFCDIDITFVKSENSNEDIKLVEHQYNVDSSPSNSYVVIGKACNSDEMIKPGVPQSTDSHPVLSSSPSKNLPSSVVNLQHSPSRFLKSPSVINFESITVPDEMASDMVEQLREHTGLSYTKSCFAIEIVLGQVAARLPQLASVMDKILMTFSEV